MKENSAPRTWADPKSAFEAWKYYEDAGGTDKNWMIKIVTWLLAFSTTIIGAQATGKLTEYRSMILLTVLGILVSILAALVALLYGGYAARNWAKAHRIAVEYHWVVPENERFSSAGWGLKGFAFWLSKPCLGQVAPVFWVYFCVSLVSLAVHCARLFWRVVYPIATQIKPK